MFRPPRAKTPEPGGIPELGKIAANGLLLLYPLLVHAVVVTGSCWLEFAALVLLGTNVLGSMLVRAGRWSWIMLVLMVSASAAFVLLGEAWLFLYAAPVLASLALMWFFGRTLLPGQIPLITRIADAIRGPLPQAVRVYTRRVTELWVAAFAGFAVADLLLALWASPVIWSLFTNFVNYLLAGALFVAEWLFRCWYMRDYESLTWRKYLVA
ncbi:MAG: hypothetical protein L0H29_00845, partial [Sinobacteraceae bacterium]|nr:hypothetical protein [Nevskiaceae bacterium]